jgi:hypothetical protein
LEANLGEAQSSDGAKPIGEALQPESDVRRVPAIEIPDDVDELEIHYHDTFF